MLATKKEENAILDCYREIYKNSTPIGSFDELVKNATINEFGQKEIPFMDYEIEEEIMIEIIDTIMKQYKIEPHRRDRFRTTILLGCSPKFKK